jgi:cytochrome c551/c552
MNLNFSTWANYDGKQKAHKKEEIAEEIMEGHMPPKSYGWMHPEAKMSESQKKAVIDWFRTGVVQ